MLRTGNWRDAMTVRWLAAGIAALGLLVAGYYVLCVPIHLPGDDFLRPRTVWHRFECVLERWGVIPYDPCRHIEG
jgi:hypothetical protein